MVDEKVNTVVLADFVSNQVTEFNQPNLHKFIEMWRELIGSDVADQRYNEISSLIVDNPHFADYVEMLLSLEESENLDSLFTLASYEFNIVKEFDRSLESFSRRVEKSTFQNYLRKWHDYLADKDHNKNMLSLKEKIKSSEEYVKQMSVLIVKNSGEKLPVLVEMALSKMRSGEAIKRYPYLTSTHELDVTLPALEMEEPPLFTREESQCKQDIEPIVDADS